MYCTPSAIFTLTASCLYSLEVCSPLLEVLFLRLYLPRPSALACSAMFGLPLNLFVHNINISFSTKGLSYMALTYDFLSLPALRTVIDQDDFVFATTIGCFV